MPALPSLLLLSFGSGVAALIYEIVWFQLLELAIGSTAVSLGVVLATFMGGTCVGSLLFPRLRNPRPMRTFAAIELCIGACGMGVLLLAPNMHSTASALLLVPPTLFMGATLPALARSVEPRSLGGIYSANIAGAVTGCLLAGFYLLRKFDVSAATYTALALNLVVAGAALMLAKPDQIEAEPVEPPAAGRGAWSVYIAIGLSGLCALAAEAIWTRLLGLLLGASVYALAIILAVFLAGLGLGSGAGTLIGRSRMHPRVALGWCQLLLAGAIAWTAYNLSASLPYWPIDPAVSSNIWFTFQLDLAQAIWAVFPPALLWGASFPLALAAAGGGTTDSARLFAGIYAANALGAIAGALSASLLLIAWIGSQHAQQLLIALSVVAGLLLLGASGSMRARLLALAGAVAGGLLTLTAPPLSKVLVAHGRYAATWVGKGEIVYAAEGRDSSVAVSDFPSGARTFHVAGKVQASSVPRDMRLQRMLGHLTTLVPPHPRSILVIGCGAGITAGAVSIDPMVERETIAEIESLVPRAAAAYFGEENFEALHNPKVHVQHDDGRHFLLTTAERFDGITVDPLDPWVKGAANLYTQEFYEAAKRHLNPGGTITMYIQLFETTEAAVKSSVATFFDVFPNGTVWGNPADGKGHDMVLLGTVEPLRIDLDAMEQRVGYRDPDSKMPQSLAEVGMNSPVDLFATFAGRASDLRKWVKGAPVNRDRNLRMQFLAGLGLDLDESAKIYSGMLAYARFPEDLFSSTEGRVDSLRESVRRAWDAVAPGR